MKITQLAAAVLMIALSGLAHADQEGPPPPPPIGAGPEVGPGPGGPGYYEGDGGYERTVVRRRTTVIPGAPIGIGAPEIAGPAAIVPARLPFPPAVSGGCGILQNRARPEIFKVSVLWRNGAPAFETEPVIGRRGIDFRISELRSLGYCLNDEHQPIMKLN